ncbi:siderophore ferric iron reductase [Halovibrio salipaludis]|nr:siderophore ferric iron reductase [Halovibrio salipaludis]
MQTSDHCDQSGLLSLAARLHPGLNGAAAPAVEPGLSPGAENTQVIAAIQRVWAEGYPEAGQPYSSVRTWTLLMWQPVFLSVLGVHGAGAVVPVDRLWQRVEQGVVAGFRLQGGWPGTPESEQERIEAASVHLLRVRDELLEGLKTVTRIKPLTANRLLADMLLIAVQRVGLAVAGFSNERVEALGRAWLAATGLRGQSRYLPLELPGGQVVLGLERRACCMHYRRDDGCYCSSCPKLSQSERERRQLEELSHEAVAV